MDIDDRVVWITGASSGIGEALARRFAERGARVVLSARRADELERVRQGMAEPQRHLVVPLDLADEAGLRRAADEVLERCGRVDVMVHNGGLSQRALARDTELAVDRRLMEVDYFGAVVLTKALLPSMRRRGAGRLVVVEQPGGQVRHAAALRLLGRQARPARLLRGPARRGARRRHPRHHGVPRLHPYAGWTYNALTGDGSPQGTLDRAQAEGMSARGLRPPHRRRRRGRARRAAGGRASERFAVYLWRLSPPSSAASSAAPG